MEEIEVIRATPELLAARWERNIADNPDDPRWLCWRDQYIRYNESGMARSYLILAQGIPVGEGTLLFSPACSAVRGRLKLADRNAEGITCANINALRIEKPWEGIGAVSRMVRLMESDAREMGITTLTIGVEAAETRNLAIYLHWGYTRFLFSEVEDGELVLYYAKDL